jgi:zinc/manganese transport system substrate-binding protein
MEHTSFSNTIMRKIIPTSLNRWAGLMFLVLGLCQPASAKLNVVATTPDFGAIASAVGGSEVSVTTLAKPTEDPHFVDAKPSFILKLNRADALIEGGADLEIGGNPHYLTDPYNAKIVATHIAEGFSNLDPKSAETYRNNLKRFNEQLEAKLNEWQSLMAPFKDQQIVAYHDSWPYFARRFNLKLDLFLEPKPGIPPTPVHLAEVILHMRSDHIRAILVEPYQNRKTAQTVAADTGATVVDAAQFPGGVKGTEGGYIELIDYDIHAVAKALGAGKQAAAGVQRAFAAK